MRHRAAIPMRRLIPIGCLLVIGVTVSCVAFFIVRSWEQTNERVEFESWAETYANAVEKTLTEYVGALLFLGDFYNNSILVTRQEFTSLMESVLPRYPGIQAFSWNPLVKDAERDVYESTAREEGFSDFEFTERDADNNLVRAARREEYVIVYYISPLETNRPAFGFDIASNETRRQAITKGFRTGKLAVTDRITLVQETGNQLGVLLLLPIYHQDTPLDSPAARWENRKGLVVEVLRIGEVVETALREFGNRDITLTLHDISAAEGERHLYHWPSPTSNTEDEVMLTDEASAGLFWSKTIDFGDHQWRLSLRPSNAYYHSRVMWQGWVTLFGSLSLTIFWVFYLSKKILHTIEVEQRARQQEQINAQLESEIGERIAAESERDATIQNLQRALDEVDTLRGILPLCSFCKKVRDDEGYWEQVDVYIHRHSQADISHSICPDCAREHYPEIYGEHQK